MLFDRLRITSQEEVGRIWSRVMLRIYNLEGLFVLNLHPERALLCKEALQSLLSFALSRPLPTWIASLKDIAGWWKERSTFKLDLTPLADNRWEVRATCTPRGTILARHLMIEGTSIHDGFDGESRVQAEHFVVTSALCPCISVSPRTPGEVVDFLREQGYAMAQYLPDDAAKHALHLDIPEGLGTSRAEQIRRSSALVEQIEQSEAPLLRIGCWPNGSRAALAITGDIDSVTVQDFFLRILEVKQAM
jgi:hypothetical protein